MKDAMKNYRNMMKRMEMIQQNKGSMSDKELDMLQGQMARENVPARMDMGLDSMMKDDANKQFNAQAMMEMSKQGTGSLSSQELKLLENMLGTTVTDEIKDAVSGLLKMGVPIEDALEALNMSMGIDMNNMAPQSMSEGALGSLPERPIMRPKPMPERLDADRTQSMDMQKTGMGT